MLLDELGPTTGPPFTCTADDAWGPPLLEAASTPAAETGEGLVARFNKRWANNTFEPVRIGEGVSPNPLLPLTACPLCPLSFGRTTT